MTPFLAVFLGEHFLRDASMADWDLNALSEEAMLEACTFLALDDLQQNFVSVSFLA